MIVFVYGQQGLFGGVNVAGRKITDGGTGRAAQIGPPGPCHNSRTPGGHSRGLPIRLLVPGIARRALQLELGTTWSWCAKLQLDADQLATIRQRLNTPRGRPSRGGSGTASRQWPAGVDSQRYLTEGTRDVAALASPRVAQLRLHR